MSANPSPPVDRLRRSKGAACLLLLVVLGTGLTLSACSKEGEVIVERWEELSELLHQERDDCSTLAEDLSAFRGEYGELFSADMKPVYEEIAQDPELHVRLERAFASVEVGDLPCLEDEAVQKEAKALFGGLVSTESE